MTNIKIEYFAELRERSGKSEEQINIPHQDSKKLYTHLKELYGFHSEWQKLRVAINHEIANWDQELIDGDVVVFIPKVAGG